MREYNILICKTHYISDGLANNRFANEFFCLLGGRDTTVELEEILKGEIEVLHACGEVCRLTAFVGVTLSIVGS